MSTFAAPRPLDPEGLTLHMDRLLRFARHLCGRDGDAEDLVQDTLERVLRRPRMVSGSEAGYLMQAMRNTHHSRLRAICSRVRTTAPGTSPARTGSIATSSPPEVVASQTSRARHGSTSACSDAKPAAYSRLARLPPETAPSSTSSP